MKVAFLVALRVIVFSLAFAPTLCSAQAANTGDDNFGTPVDKPDQSQSKPSPEQTPPNESKKAASEKTSPDQESQAKPTATEEEKKPKPLVRLDPTIVVAIISAFAAILVGYWQFVYKPKKS